MKRLALTAALPFLLAACATTDGGAPQAAAAAAPVTIAVTLDNFSFGPSDIQMTAGQPYVLELTNVGFPHDFTAPEFFAAADVAAEDAGKISNGVVDVPPGTTVTIHLTPAAGSYDLLCVRPGHADNGMTGSITVS